MISHVAMDEPRGAAPGRGDSGGGSGGGGPVSSMDDMELFPRQAVIVKNGKIFFEDEPFFCAGEAHDDKSEAADKAEERRGGGGSRQAVDSNRSEFSAACFDDLDSEKENRICRDLIIPETHAEDLHACGDVDSEDDSEDEEEEEDEDERFLKLVDREEFYEDVDGLRLQGLPDGPLDPTEYLDFMHSGQEVQRISVITALPNLLKENNAECMRRVVPKVREVLYVAQQDMQLAASSAFLQILQDQLIPVQNYTQTFLQTILSSVDSKDSEVAAAWLDTLLDVIDLLPKEIIKKDILSIAISKGQISQPVQARLSCCKILGKVATKFEPFVIKKEILPVVQQLCQDVEHEVRACMCFQLESVARGLGLETTKAVILPELLELADDEESDVRIMGLDTFVNIVSLLDDETREGVVVPLVHKFCNRAMTTHDRTLPFVAKQFGKICHGLESNLNGELKHFFIHFYKKLCKMGLQEKSKSIDKQGTPGSYPYDDEDRHVQTRQNAAFNFPAMVLFVGVKSFKSDLHPIFGVLCKDPHVAVRQTMASCFHEIAKLLGANANMIFPEMIVLLKDESIEVLQGVVSSFSLTLDGVPKNMGFIADAKGSLVMEVVSALLSAETVVFASNNWRLQEDMMNNMACLGKVCSSDMLYTRVIPVLLHKMKHGRALPVRYAASRSLLVLMRCIRRLDQRQYLVDCILEDFCQGHSCHSRSLFLVICKYVIELYSKAFFKDNFFLYVLPLTFDPVPNIRMRACALLPDLKRLIKLPYDTTLKSSLEACIRKVLVNEKDKDVLFTMKNAVDELDQIHVQMELTIPRLKPIEEDADDLVKEEEERQLLELEEKERKEEEMKAIKMDKRHSVPSKRDLPNTKIPAPKRSHESKMNRIGQPSPAKPVQNTAKPEQRRSVGSPSTSTTSTAVTEFNGMAEGQESVLLPHMIKSKSTTSIPSLSHIPRPASRPSTPPRKEASCRIPVLHSLGRPAASGPGTGLTKQNSSATRLGTNVTAASRKGSVGSLPSTTARRGSLGSACSTKSDPSGSRAKSKPNNGGSAGGLASNKPIRKISKS